MPDSTQPLTTWFETRVRKLTDDIEELAYDVAGKGQEFMWDAIETRGTGKTWKKVHYKNGEARRGSSPGRDWTGHMKESAETEVTRRPDSIVASFGWIEIYEEYFGLQEGGFEHPNGDDVPGMFIMADAEDFVMEYTTDQLGRILNDL